MTVKEYLQQEPKKSEILRNPQGGYYLGIEAVSKKMDELKGMGVRFNFAYLVHNFIPIRDRSILVSGSINCMVEIDGIELNLVGAATFPMGQYGENTHYAATLKSLCIVNALSNEYPCFGKNLNPKNLVLATEETPGLREPDVIVLEQYRKATDEQRIELRKKYNIV